MDNDVTVTPETAIISNLELELHDVRLDLRRAHKRIQDLNTHNDELLRRVNMPFPFHRPGGVAIIGGVSLPADFNAHDLLRLKAMLDTLLLSPEPEPDPTGEQVGRSEPRP